jgi:hypothetical protein
MPQSHADRRSVGRIKLRKVAAAEDCDDPRWMSKA